MSKLTVEEVRIVLDKPPQPIQEGLPFSERSQAINSFREAWNNLEHAHTLGKVAPPPAAYEGSPAQLLDKLMKARARCAALNIDMR